MRFLAVTLFSVAGPLLLAQQPVMSTANGQAAGAPAAQSASQPSQTNPSSTVNQTPSEAAPASSQPASQQASPKPGEGPSTMPPGTSIVPTETPKELAQAKRAFEKGVKLKSAGKLDQAYEKFEQAAELNPHNLDYITAREFTRQQLVMEALQRGNKAMKDHNEIVAMADFRRAIEYDPTNDFALQRLRDSMPEDLEPTSHNMRVVEQSTPIELLPSGAHHDFHFRGDARTLLTQVAQAYGIVAEFDDSVQRRRVRFDIEDINFATAMNAAMQVTKTFWVHLSSLQVLFAADTVENRRNLERMSLRTFYLPDVTSDQQLNEMMNSLRVLLNLRYIAAQKSQSTITIRAEQQVVEAAARLLESLSTGAPEVMLDMRVYEISSTLARQIGTAWPTQFTMFNISPALLGGLGQNAQNLINQLIASGGINQANSTAIQALLAQLANQSNSILSQPFATFGGGLTLFGLTTGGTGVTISLSLNDANLRDLEHVTLRAGQNDPAVLKIGERYPLVNATFSPIYNSPAIAQVIGNASYRAPFPSFYFEDLGLIMKATPVIHAERDVTLKLELAIRSLGTQTVNGMPIINNREYNGTITVKDGESSVVTGLLSRADALSLTGYPFLSRVPVLNYASAEHNKNAMDDELLVVITPHIVRIPERNSFAVALPNSQ
jgi:type II secretory pathway component GspD/PulD (secretin)